MITMDKQQDAASTSDAMAIKIAVQHVLASDAFARAQRMRELLHFLVEQKLSGSQRDTQEYAVGIEVFKRDPATYNTCTDPIVRVQVGRLRERLRAYYAGAGANDTLRFVIPVGSYMPEIVIRPATQAALPMLPGPSRRLDDITLAAPELDTQNYGAPSRVRINGIARHYLLAHRALIYCGGDADGTAFVRGLDEELVHQLYCAFGATIVPRADCERLTAVSHRLEGSVRIDGNQVRLSLRLVDNKAGSIVWSQQFDACASCTILVQDNLAEAACAALRQYFAHG
jgi:TolB-like protein